MSFDLDEFAPSGPLPPGFYSAHDEGPFEACSDCGSPVISPAAVHLIGKVWKESDVIFEYALCMSCVMKLYLQYSEESKRNLAEYFAMEAPPPEDGSPHCGRCGRTGEDLTEEYSAEVLASGSTMLGRPIRICGACSDGAEAVLSKKTREAFDDFVRRVAPHLPEDVGIPSPVLALP